MDFLKKLFDNDKTVVGLCDLKRRQTFNSFNFSRQYNFGQPFCPVPEQAMFAGAKF